MLDVTEQTISEVFPPYKPGETAAGREIYRCTKTYDHNEGLSCCFRQWPARHSHCRLIHGYALAFAFRFATSRLDQHNWCFDFGGMKQVKQWLHHMFDHTMLVAGDDPQLSVFRYLSDQGLVNLRVLPQVGCEALAKIVFDHVAQYVDQQTAGRVWLEAVEVKEHQGNSAAYQRDHRPS